MAIRQKGNKFQVDVTVKGVRAPRVSCDTRAEAAKVEARFKAHLLAGGSPEDLVGSTSGPGTVSAGKTLGDMLAQAVTVKWRGTKAEETSTRNGESWCEELGYNFPAADLGAEKIADITDAWGAKGLSPATINRKIAALSVMLGIAHDMEWIDKKPKLHRKKEYEGRLRYFTDDEVDSLIAHTGNDAPLRDLFILAVETGMRQGELLKLTVRDVDLDRGVVTLYETKGNRRRSVPLTRRAKAAAANHVTGRMAHELVFPSRLSKRALSRVMCAWKAKRGLPPNDEACFHTFRHTTCSRLIMAGVSPVVVQHWMGHAVLQTTMNYTHLAPTALDPALAALNERNS